MSKLFKLKKWLSIEDTAKKLSLTFDEDVSIKDVLQFILNGELSVSWYIQSELAMEITKELVLVLFNNDADEYLQTTTSVKYIDHLVKSLEPNESLRIHTIFDPEFGLGGSNLFKDYKQQAEREWINGVFKLHLDYGLTHSIIENWIFDTGVEFSNDSGEVLESEDGVLYTIIDPSIDKTSAHVWKIKPYNSFKSPKPEELIISTQDIDNFISSINSPMPIKKLRGSQESLTISLGIMTELLFQKIKLNNKSKKLNFSELSRTIEQEAATLGVDLKDVSNLQRALSESHKILQSLIK